MLAISGHFVVISATRDCCTVRLISVAMSWHIFLLLINLLLDNRAGGGGAAVIYLLQLSCTHNDIARGNSK